MNILYIYAHPNLSSFNGLLKEQALHFIQSENQGLKISDLYADHFNPVASWDDFQANSTEYNTQYFLAQQEAYQNKRLSQDITQECEKIAWANHIIFQFPLWWFSVPAILKGWFDRVLLKGFAYDAGKIFETGLLKGKTASLVLTTQSPESAYQLDGSQHATIDTFLHHIHHTLHFVGIKTLDPFVLYAAFNLEHDQIDRIMKNYVDYLGKIITQ